MKVSGQFHAPAALLRGEQPRYPLDRRLGGPHSRSGRCEDEKNLLPLPESNLDSSVVQSVAWSLYRLSYPGSYIGVMAKCKLTF
jgi:hypothetical protein